MNRTYHIMRGLPGSGKSTWVKEFWRNMTPGTYPIVVSADKFHMEGDRYVFKPERAREAHAECFRQFLATFTEMDPTITDVFVDNTNTTLWELAPYYRVAEVLAKAEIVEIDCPIAIACGRNVHDVPMEKVAQMGLNLMQSSHLIPTWWNRRIIQWKE